MIKNHYKLKAVEQEGCIFDPMLVKPKCLWEAVDFLQNYKLTAEDCTQF